MAENKISQAAVDRVESGIESMLRSLAVTRPEDIKENFAEILRSVSEKAVEAVVAEGAKIVVPRSEEDAIGWLGEGIHTGLRKGADSRGAHEAWVAINGSGEAWHDAVSWFYYTSEISNVVTIADEES